jgi:predicted transcriptional regulator
MRGESAETHEANTDLTTRARALYERSSMPVREIARLCGVTERTIYKYAQKHGWKNRYRWCGMKEGDTARWRGWRPRKDFAAVKGAGGRFIRREDKGKSFARGLKATDPAGHKRATAECREAEHLARAAQAEAEKARRVNDCARAHMAVNRALRAYTAHIEEYRKKHPLQRTADDEFMTSSLVLSLQAATKWWRMAQAEVQQHTRA